MSLKENYLRLSEKFGGPYALVKKGIKGDITKGTTLERLVFTALYTGMRRAELMNLRYEDVDPDKTLSDAMEKAGIKVNEVLVPCKTLMHFYNDGSVAVRCGYGAPYIDLIRNEQIQVSRYETRINTPTREN